MAVKVFDFRRLAEDAAKTVYDPRAKRCWPWSHRWTMWKPNFTGSAYQRRTCIRCGRTKQELIG